MGHSLEVQDGKADTDTLEKFAIFHKKSLTVAITLM